MPRRSLLVLALVLAVGCSKKEESGAEASAEVSATPVAEGSAEPQAAGEAVGERMPTPERARPARGRETVRSDAPKTKAVGSE